MDSIRAWRASSIFFLASSKLFPRTATVNCGQLPVQPSSSGQNSHSNGTDAATGTFTASGGMASPIPICKVRFDEIQSSVTHSVATSRLCFSIMCFSSDLHPLSLVLLCLPCDQCAKSQIPSAHIGTLSQSVEMCVASKPANLLTRLFGIVFTATLSPRIAPHSEPKNWPECDPQIVVGTAIEINLVSQLQSQPHWAQVCLNPTSRIKCTIQAGGAEARNGAH